MFEFFFFSFLHAQSSRMLYLWVEQFEIPRASASLFLQSFNYYDVKNENVSKPD